MTQQVAEQLKIDGMELSASKYGPDLCRAQLVAEMLGLGGELVTSDAVRAAFFEHYQRELKIGNALGSLFEADKWECVGRVKSHRAEAHGRYIGQWRMRGK